MAQNNAKSAEVKEFARMLVKDDGESFGHLAELAAKTGVTIPRGINASRIPAIEGLTNLNGAPFDRQFTKDEIAAEEHPRRLQTGTEVRTEQRPQVLRWQDDSHRG
jgi:predicted outer membrane protein